MSFLRTIQAWLRGIDPAYDDVPVTKLPRYQHYIDKILMAIDVHTQTAWSMSRPFDKERFRKDEETMGKIVLEEAAQEGLSPGVLQVMLHQYFFADVYQREIDRDRWAHRVLHRKKMDYFPDAASMAELLSRVTSSGT